MVAKGCVHTIKERHSVKEAVISVVVSPQIQTPSSYAVLLEEGNPLYGLYHKFEPIKTVEVKMDLNFDGPQYKNITDNGFKFISFKDGKASEIIQGLNQYPNSGIFTFNTINYTCWSDFKTSVLKLIGIIAKHNPNYNVQSFGVLYIDEFYFDDKNNYHPDELFNINSRMLPKGVFDSSVMNCNLAMRKTQYQENFSLSIFDANTRKIIQIIDNVTLPVKPMNFLDFANYNEFYKNLDFAHEENKRNLADILNTDVSKLIDLIK